jgi:hemerythrin-like domain-containing protein
MASVDIISATPCDSAIAIIKQEHRSLGYLVHTLQRVLHDVSAHKADADYGLIATMLYYIEAFPDSCHHPKEEEHLFKQLRARTNLADGILDQLQDQHIVFARMISSVGQAFVHWQGGAPNGLQPLSQAVAAYAELLWDHIEQEEDQVLAIARGCLSEYDWRAINAAFCANDDPLFGPHIRDEFTKLKLRIVNDLPPRIKNRPAR